MVFLCYSRRYLNRRNDANDCFSDKLDDLVDFIFFAAIRAELVWHISQAFEAGAMPAEKGTLRSLVVVVFFQTNVALAAIFFRRV